VAKKLKPGDVLEIHASAGGNIYLLYAGKHAVYGDGVWVCPAVQATRPALQRDFLPGAYFTFYPANAAVGRGMAQVVGSLAGRGMPNRLRRPGARIGGQVKTWVIESASGDVVKKELSEEELHLPIASIWNHEFLLDRVAEGWRPEREGRS